ncbi:helix-turn-helix domain-containing protein [Arthrobacter sp. fls2-241-R2A-172]|uniref:helix-turn-helix domain-containing protein n=1 Tax=Arthrobacter sp. fls2-241-R2A-172 TaxID=3040325 RepID=UPI003307096B
MTHRVSTASIEPRDMPPTLSVWPDAARALGIGRATAYDLIKRGEFPIRVLRLGRKFRVSRADLLTYLGESQP